MGAEDFGLFGQGGVPTFMFRLGTIPPERMAAMPRPDRREETLPSLHSAQYFPDALAQPPDRRPGDDLRRRRPAAARPPRRPIEMIDPRYPIHQARRAAEPLAGDLRGRRPPQRRGDDRDGRRGRPAPAARQDPQDARADPPVAESMGIHKHKARPSPRPRWSPASGGTDVLIAYPIVGPNLARFARLVEVYPQDDLPGDRRPAANRPANLSGALCTSHIATDVPTLVDLDIGMGRTGIAPGPSGPFELYALVESICPPENRRPVQAYDGQIRDSRDPRRRREGRRVRESRRSTPCRRRLIARGLPVPRLVMGGTPTFPIHAKDETPGRGMLAGDLRAARRGLPRPSSPTSPSSRPPSS